MKQKKTTKMTTEYTDSELPLFLKFNGRAISTHSFYDIKTNDTKKSVLVALFQQYVKFDFHKKGEGSPLGVKFFFLSNHGFIHLPEFVLKSTLRIKKQF